VCVLYRDAYEQLPQEARETYFRSEYRLCATGCIAAAADTLIRSGSRESIAYVLELGDEGSGRCVDVINALLSSKTGYGNRFRVLSTHLENKRNAVALQAADMLAFVVRRAAQSSEPPDSRLLPLVSMPISHRVLTAENLRNISNELSGPDMARQREVFARLFTRRQKRRQKPRPQ